MSRPRIAIATCTGYDDLKVDDVLLARAFAERGAEAIAVVWDGDEVDWAELDLCLVRSTWDYHDKYVELAGQGVPPVRRSGSGEARRPLPSRSWRSRAGRRR